jgi:hypothetical protein
VGARGRPAIGLVQVAPHRVVTAGVVAGTCAGLAMMALVSRDITRDFEPFGRIVVAADDIVAEWSAVRIELREYLAQKKQPGASARLSANPAEAVDVVAFALHSHETDPHGRRVRWMSAPATELFIRADVRRVEIPLRHAIEVFRDPVTAVIEVDGRILDRITFTSGDWRQSSLTLRESDIQWWRRMHHVVIRVDRVWIPADAFPGSQDRRTLGLQVGEIIVK